MNTTKTQSDTVPFDPGFAPFTLVFSTTYELMQDAVRKFKNANQRKMKYKFFEPGLIKLCDNLISFYFCGMLYGAYLKNQYKESPKIIEGNDFLGLNADDCKNGDVVIEVSSLEHFIKTNDNNPFASRKINPKYNAIIDAYIEFLEKNNYFVEVKTTDDIKLPKLLSGINKYSQKSLDELYGVLIDTINSKKIEKILSSKYFDKI